MTDWSVILEQKNRRASTDIRDAPATCDNDVMLALLAALAFAAPARAGESVPAEFAERVDGVVSGFTVRSEIGPAETPLPLPLSNFLLDHPDLSAFIVNRRKLAPYKIEMTGPRSSSADDGDGTRGLVHLLVREDRHRLYYGEGVHHCLLFPDIRASAVIVMDLDEKPGADGRPRTLTKFRVYVRMRSGFLAGLMKTVRPFIQSTVIRKFTKVLFVADEVGHLMAKDPALAVVDLGDFSGLSAEDRAAGLSLIDSLRPALPVSARP